MSEDEKLVGALLEVYRDYSANELGKMLDGITASDISRWRRGEWEYLTGKKRRAVRRALSEAEGGDPAPDLRVID